MQRYKSFPTLFILETEIFFLAVKKGKKIRKKGATPLEPRLFPESNLSKPKTNLTTIN
jgi:hypothetical protein